jgi:hypothetical protein
MVQELFVVVAVVPVVVVAVVDGAAEGECACPACALLLLACGNMTFFTRAMVLLLVLLRLAWMM